MREKTDKFQQRRLDGFFKVGVKAADESNAAEEPEALAMPEVMAMEIEMEVWRPSALFHTNTMSSSMLSQFVFHRRTRVPVNAASVSLLTQT